MSSQKLKTSKTKTCEVCGNVRLNLKAALKNGHYYKSICAHCLGDNDDDVSSNAAGYDRRRGYEDNAQETIQPYDANGANPEFARLYPSTAKKVFGEKLYNELRSKI